MSHIENAKRHFVLNEIELCLKARLELRVSRKNLWLANTPRSGLKLHVRLRP